MALPFILDRKVRKVVASWSEGIWRLDRQTLTISIFILWLLASISGAALMLFEPTLYENRYFSVMVDYITLLPALSNPFGREDTSFFHGWTSNRHCPDNQ